MAVVHTQILPNATLDRTKTPPVITGDLTVAVDVAFEIPSEGIQEFTCRAPSLASDVAQKYAHAAAVQAQAQQVQATIDASVPWSLQAPVATAPPA